MASDPVARRSASVRAYQEAINRADVETVLALFHEDARIDDEGVPFLVRPFHEYTVGTQEQISLSAFTAEDDQIKCLCDAINALDRALGYEGKPRKLCFTFRGERIARLVIPPSDVEEARRLHTLSTPFFTWVRKTHPEQWRIMQTVTLEGGSILAALAHQWRALQRSKP